MVKGSHATDEQKAKNSVSHIGHIMSAETRAKISVAGTKRRASPETRAKMSTSLMGNKRGLGHKVSEANRLAISRACLGRPFSEERKAKLSVAMMGKSPPNKGVPMSDEQKVKLSVAQTGRKASPETKAKLSEIRKGVLNSHWRGGPKISGGKKTAKHRTLGFVPLNKPFGGADAHHVSKEYVVYVPRDLHKSVPHNVWTGKNMEQVNLLAFGYLVQQLEVAA